MADSVDAAFDGLGNEPGIKAWTIKAFKLEPVPEGDLGTFFSGDSYIVLRTYESPSSTSNALRHDIHFWLGKDSSQDEQASAALYATQLDDYLGGGPVQYRQVQEAESPEFRQLFPRAIYRKGGLHASGFKSVDDTKDPIKLHQVRSESRTSCQVYEVPASVDSLNSGDAFIAEDCSGKALFIWYGSATNIREKMKAVEAANALKAAHGGAVRVAVVDEGELDSTDALAFFNLLGVSNPASISIGSADAVSAPSSTSSVFDPARLFKVSSGAHSELPSPLSRDQLTTEAQFGLVAAGCVWVWTGAGAPAGAKAAAFGTGAKLAQSLGMSSNTVVKCIKERFEPGLFTTYFPDWSRGMYLAMLEARANGQTGASPATSASVADLDTVVSGMLEGAEEDAMAVQAATQKRMKAYGVEGSLKVWLVRDSRLLEVPEDEGGEFYGADSYVVLYSYQTGSGQQSNVVYFWLGRHSSNIEGGSAALLATNMAKEEFGSKTPIVLVVQNQEPQHFVRIFKNGLVVHKGDRPDMSRGDAAHADGTRLYQIKGEGVQAAHAVEVEAVTKSLNSSDCYVLSAPGASSVLLWQGKYSSRVEREVAASVAARLARPSGGVDLVKEGEEPPSFWDSLGGQADYPRFDASRVSHLPILYHIHDLSGGNIKVEPHSSFSQDDLSENDAMMLDAVGEVYLWYGKSTDAAKRERAVGVANRFVQTVCDNGQQTHKASVVEIESGNEPPFFTMHFPGWDSEAKSSTGDVYAAKLKALTVDA